MKRFDERDTLLARSRYKKNTGEYEDYYKRNPNIREMDDEIREMPGLLAENTPTYDSINVPLVASTFRFLSDIRKYSQGKANSHKTEVPSHVMSGKLKGLARYYGSDLVGIAALTEQNYYSHRGRGPQNYGVEIKDHHKYAIVFAVEMDRDMIDRAPKLEQFVETAKGYVKSAVIGMVLSYFIRELGYEARNNMDGDYLMPVPFIAEKAGLGQIGRIGILVTKEFGPRVRLGAVTTNMELIPDSNNDFGLVEFCKSCNECSKSCPGKAISTAKPREENGSLLWQTKPENCFKFWQKIGTDCGVCMSACPFSHNIERGLIEKIPGQKQVIQRILKDIKEKKKGRVLTPGYHQWL